MCRRSQTTAPEMPPCVLYVGMNGDTSSKKSIIFFSCLFSECCHRYGAVSCTPLIYIITYVAAMHKQTNNYFCYPLHLPHMTTNKPPNVCVPSLSFEKETCLRPEAVQQCRCMRSNAPSQKPFEIHILHIPEARAEYVWGCVCVCVRLCNWVSEWVWRRILHRAKKMDVDDILYTYIYRNDDDDHQADSIRWQVRKKEEAFLTITKQQHFATNNIIQ